MDYSLTELEHSLVKVKELQTRLNGSDGYNIIAGYKTKKQRRGGGEVTEIWVRTVPEARTAPEQKHQHQHARG